jgi:hypothetical protein
LYLCLDLLQIGRFDWSFHLFAELFYQLSNILGYTFQVQTLGNADCIAHNYLLWNFRQSNNTELDPGASAKRDAMLLAPKDLSTLTVAGHGAGHGADESIGAIKAPGVRPAVCKPD